ncbi:sugar phosphate isomerase/epimerase family protein [Candidatus Lokiarchaeum ossiferum]|uniref:sugar phosphate isomerase/epimerase family protein n=1 Tax=Candidatus Lokiarchaeum ossiferum TaxID=2951803 RepID=UPI00352C14C4
MSSWNVVQNHISFHAVYNSSILDALKFANHTGFKGIQIAVEVPHLSFEQLSDEDCFQIRNYAKKHDLYITLHAPDDVVSLFVVNPALQQGIFAYYTALFDFAEKIGACLITIHLGKMTTFPTDTIPELKYPEEDLLIYWEALENNLGEIVKSARNRFILCVENYYFNPFILEVLEPLIQDEEIFLCWDIAKTFTRSGEKIAEIEAFFLDNLSQIRQVHLHDIHNYRSHRSIGEGIIDFAYFIKLLKDVTIEDYCIEVRPHSRAVDSYKKLEKIIQNH